MTYPNFEFANAESMAWQPDPDAPGVEIKTLHSVEGQIMELYRFPANTSFPDHKHSGPEFVYMLAGRARFDGQWIEAGWSGAAGTGSIDQDFVSGENGCVYLAVYKKGSAFL